MEIRIIGGGLAGTEAAYQIASMGGRVFLYEMRPVTRTPAHKTDSLSELVCSNSLKSQETTNAHGLLKAELRLLGSLIVSAAERTAIPGGKALVVDRARFRADVTSTVLGASQHPGGQGRSKGNFRGRHCHRGDRPSYVAALKRAHCRPTGGEPPFF